jgi:ankyrin repeat protein
MLPLHYACIFPVSVEVIDALVQLYPESLVKQNVKGATPLHFAVTNSNATVDFVDFVNQVCVERAASAADDKGMLTTLS